MEEQVDKEILEEHDIYNRNDWAIKENTNLFFEKIIQLVFAIIQPPQIWTIHHPDQPISLLEIVSPIRPYGSLPSHIPYVQSVPKKKITSIPNHTHLDMKHNKKIEHKGWKHTFGKPWFWCWSQVWGWLH